MPLKESTYPPEFRTACETAIQQPHVYREPSGNREAKREAHGTSHSVFTFPVYVLSIRSVIKGTGVADAKLAGYLMLTSYHRRGAVSAEVPLAGYAGQRNASRTMGPVPEAALEAYRKVQELKEIEGHNYEPYVLRIPALRTEAFWLKVSGYAGQDRDLIVPYLTYSQELLKNPVMSMTAFLSTIKPLAQRELERARPKD